LLVKGILLSKPDIIGHGSIDFTHVREICVRNNASNHSEGENLMKKYRCAGCDYIYDPAAGDPDSGIAPGTSFDDIPDSWVCPVCGLTKEDFEPAD